MVKKYFVIDLDDDIMEEFDNKNDANDYVTELLPNYTDAEANIIVIYGEELKYDVKAFINKKEKD